MDQHLGIICALAAMLAWGFGDFFIQKSVRGNSVMRTLFYICISGGLALFPFVKDDFVSELYDGNLHFLLVTTGLIIFVAAILEFEAMRRGKIAIIEPILSFELPIAIILSIFLRKENLTAWQIMPIIAAFTGILLASQFNKHLFEWRRIKMEKGVFLAVGGAMLMGLVNFMVGVSSQETSALLTIWYTNVLIAIICAVHFTVKKEWKFMRTDLKKNPLQISLTCLLDNTAWIAYAFATTLIPISIATTISESYIALTVILGILINREKMRVHQIAGIGLTIAGIFTLTIV